MSTGLLAEGVHRCTRKQAVTGTRKGMDDESKGAVYIEFRRASAVLVASTPAFEPSNHSAKSDFAPVSK